MSKKNGNGHKPKFSLPVAVILGFMPLIGQIVNAVKTAGFQGLRDVVPMIVPYDPQTRRISFSWLPYGLYPIIAGILVHKFAGMVGINRTLSRIGLPWVRI